MARVILCKQLKMFLSLTDEIGCYLDITVLPHYRAASFGFSQEDICHHAISIGGRMAILKNHTFKESNKISALS